MNIKTLFVFALLGLSLSAAAQFTTVSKAYEIGIENFRAPVTAHGVATFKSCDTCDQLRVRATPGTSYVVNGKSVTLEKFRDAIVKSGGRINAPVIVLHHLESDTLVSITINI